MVVMSARSPDHLSSSRRSESSRARKRSKPAAASGAAALTPGLYLVATPIGNLEDVTLRALRTLREADLLLAEDTRHTRILLSHHDIAKSSLSLNAHNEQSRVDRVLTALVIGFVAVQWIIGPILGLIRPDATEIERTATVSRNDPSAGRAVPYPESILDLLQDNPLEARRA